MISQTVLHRFNNSLSFVVVILAIYIIGTPYLPELTLLQTKAQTTPTEKTQTEEKENSLIIPKIGINAPILEGSSAAVLDSGIWRRPKSAKPGEGSNTVLVGHRFLYTSGTNTFYHLPKLSKGDVISVYWNNKEYIYSVFETKVVTPEESSIEKPNDSELLTIYTCTPLWNPTHRFVVTAKLL